jgi:hypothetical protein
MTDIIAFAPKRSEGVLGKTPPAIWDAKVDSPRPERSGAIGAIPE